MKSENKESRDGPVLRYRACKCYPKGCDECDGTGKIGKPVKIRT